MKCNVLICNNFDHLLVALDIQSMAHFLSKNLDQYDERGEQDFYRQLKPLRFHGGVGPCPMFSPTPISTEIKITTV